MCSLRVLDSSWTKINTLPPSISNLKNLRTLSLHHCDHLNEVPSLSQLEELRLLDLSGTTICELPPGVEAMVKLQCLNLDRTRRLRVFRAGIIPKLSLLEELTIYESRWMWSSMTEEGANTEEIINSTRLANLKISYTNFSDFLHHVKSGKWQMMQSFSLCAGEPIFLDLPIKFSVEIKRQVLSGEENSLLLRNGTQWLILFSCQIYSLRHFTRSLNKSELCRCIIVSCNAMEFLMADEEPLLPDLKELEILNMSELLVLCKGIPSIDALKSLELLVVRGCQKLKHLFPARLLQQLRHLST